MFMYIRLALLRVYILSGGGVVDSRILKKLMVEKQNVYLSLLLINVLTIFVILNIGALSYFLKNLAMLYTCLYLNHTFSCL